MRYLCYATHYGHKDHTSCSILYHTYKILLALHMTDTALCSVLSELGAGSLKTVSYTTKRTRQMWTVAKNKFSIFLFLRCKSEVLPCFYGYVIVYSGPVCYVGNQISSVAVHYWNWVLHLDVHQLAYNHNRMRSFEVAHLLCLAPRDFAIILSRKPIVRLQAGIRGRTGYSYSEHL